MKSKIRQKKIIYTYLQHPEKLAEKHVLVSTRVHEGFDPANKYNEDMETMAFSTWNIGTDPRGILSEHHESEGIYAAHNAAVKKFIFQGYKKIKSKVLACPEGSYAVTTYSKAA